MNELTREELIEIIRNQNELIDSLRNQEAVVTSVWETMEPIEIVRDKNCFFKPDSIVST